MNFVNNIFSLENKVSLITGAYGALGQRFAFTLGKAGAHLILAGKDKQKLHSLQEKLRYQHLSVESIQMDVRDVKSVESAVKEATDRCGKIDILVNNAGIGRVTPLEAASSLETWEEVFQVNVMGAWFASKAVAIHMRHSGTAGAIINIASAHGRDVLITGTSAYASSKAALIQLTRQMACELGPYGIRVNALLPGFIYSGMVGEFVSRYRKKIVHQVPLRTIADPAHLDGALLLLASGRAGGYITGACLNVDGGVSICAHSLDEDKE